MISNHERGKVDDRGKTSQRQLQERFKFQRTIERLDVENNRHLAKISGSFLVRNAGTRLSKSFLLRTARVHSDPVQYIHHPRDQGLLQPVETRQCAQFLLDGGDEVLRLHYSRG